MAAKPISIKGAGRKRGGCAWKASGLTPGGLRRVLIGLREPRGCLTTAQESAEGIVGEGSPKA